jgi:hypothetical protein
MSIIFMPRRERGVDKFSEVVSFAVEFQRIASGKVLSIYRKRELANSSLTHAWYMRPTSRLTNRNRFSRSSVTEKGKWRKEPPSKIIPNLAPQMIFGASPFFGGMWFVLVETPGT